MMMKRSLADIYLNIVTNYPRTWKPMRDIIVMFMIMIVSFGCVFPKVSQIAQHKSEDSMTEMAIVDSGEYMGFN